MAISYLISFRASSAFLLAQPSRLALQPDRELSSNIGWIRASPLMDLGMEFLFCDDRRFHEFIYLLVMSGIPMNL